MGRVEEKRETIMNIPSDEKFKSFIEEFHIGKYNNPSSIPPEIWGSKAWETLNKKSVEEIFIQLIRFNIERAKRTMPIVYGKVYDDKDLSGDKVNTLEDFWDIPLLVKDATINGISFREKVKENPFILLPNDVKSGTYVYKSGGTKGVATPTFLTNFDIEVEGTSVKKCFEYMGIKQGDTILSTYNPTHKGGEMIKVAANKLGATFIPRRMNDTSEEVINTINMYNANVLSTVQGPLEEGDKTKKGGGVDFLSLVEAGQHVLEEKVDKLFITGYKLIPEVITWAESFNKSLTTALGSSEALPQATNTNFPDGLCKFNFLHILNGPHFVEVLKLESGAMVPVKKGEEGILVYTTLAREGTLYIRYSPGDIAKVITNEGECKCGLNTKIISDIGRADTPQDVITAGCCIG